MKAVTSAYRRSFGRVALVIESMGGGGAQQVVAGLLEQWVKRGDDPVLITFQPESSDTVHPPSTVQRYVIGNFGRSNYWLKAIISNLKRIFRLRRAIINGNVDTVVTFMTTTNILTVLATLNLDVRVVISERNDLSRQSLKRCWQILRRLTYPLAYRVTANTKAALSAMSGYVSSDCLALVRNPLRRDQGAPAENLEPPFVLAVGRLHHQKNYPALLNAFAKARLHGWRLRILGDGEERENIENIAAKLGIAALLDMPGHVEDPFPHYRAARTFVMLSNHEGSPNALWEAMSCGLPSIVSDSIEGAFEVAQAGEHVIAVPSNDEERVATALKTLALDCEYRKKIGQKAASLVAREFEIDNIVKSWDEAIFCKEIQTR